MPSSSDLWICAQVKVTITASQAVSICLITGALVVTLAVLTVWGVRFSVGIPDNLVWLLSPKRVLKVTSWKLKSEVSGLVLSAEEFKTGVSFKNTSFKAALLYSVDVRSVIPAFDGVEKPSISPQILNLEQ